MSHSSQLDALTAALADRYAIERELGAGGMATVYLAHDIRHDRKVAIKVLRPELSSVLGPERFLKEIKVTANLQHPHILPLFDSGEANSFLYYVMPFVEGESLADKLRREKQLSVEECLEISQQVASALHYAHERGVMHRDIKPDNIMLTSGHAVVADFGIARAVDVAGGQQLTGTGMAIGTPAYMSPEQSAGESNVDGRTDIYALASVLYELLAGEPPFTGPSAAAIIAKRMSAPIPMVRVLRETVPEQVERAVAKAMQRAPADRFATAAEFAKALRGETAMVVPASGETQPVRVTRRPVSFLRPAATLGAVALVGAAGFGWWMLGRDGIGGDLDPDVIAVMPFRVGGDPAFGYLRESLLDLLGARLTGETGGPRVLESRTTLSAWRRVVDDEADDLSENDSRRVAAQLGAGQVILGNAVATPTELTVAASLIRVSDGTLLASGSALGPRDSLAVLVNRLTAQLLSLEAGEARGRLEGLGTTSLAALQQYLEGRNAYRAGDYIQAIQLYGRAFQLDSNFVQAGFAIVSANPFAGDAITMAGRFASPGVWRQREKLSPSDRAFLMAVPWVGPNFPEPSSFSDLITQAEAGVNGSPKSAEHWLLLGQLLARQGAYSGVPDWAERATQALDRAIALDSSYDVALQTRLLVALLRDDIADIRRIAAVYERLGPTEFSGDLMLGGAAVKLGDSTKIIASRDRFDEFSQQNLFMMPLYSILLGLPLGDAHRALAMFRDLSATQLEGDRGFLGEVALAVVEGHVQEAIALLEANTPWLPVLKNAHYMNVALFEAPYRAAAMKVAARVAAAYPNVGPLPAATGITDYPWPVLNDCHGSLLRLVQGDTSGTRAAIRRLRNRTAEAPLPATLDLSSSTLEHGEEVPLDPRSHAANFINAALASARIFGVCPLLLEVMLDGPAGLDALDSVMQAGPQGSDNFTVPGAFANLVIARMREAQGDIDGALAAVRRRSHDVNPGFLWPLPSLLRQEGRLAAMAGDTTGAVRAYEHYLTLRTNPDPPLQPMRDSVVAELARLVER